MKKKDTDKKKDKIEQEENKIVPEDRGGSARARVAREAVIEGDGAPFSTHKEARGVRARAEPLEEGWPDQRASDLRGAAAPARENPERRGDRAAPEAPLARPRSGSDASGHGQV